ncbi:M14 family zinc carboxypeptidase [Niallia sp. 03133]|uniref:M14 family zinc carboxypeptidase n=1 Tax=Niallia sp. 03133 TaxID=3458060 RepID=UPI00404494D5
MKKIIVLTSILLLFFPLGTNAEESIIDKTEPYSFIEFQNDVWRLKNKFKASIQVQTIGTSEYGRKLYAIKVGDGSKNVLMIGAHHGREWITSLLLMKMIENYANAATLHQNFDDVSIWFVPMLNPDGVTIQQGELYKFPFFAKRNIKNMNNNSSDFSRWKSNAMGIDLNRQYPSGWNELKETSKMPSYKNYKGKQPLEAKEVQAIVQFTKKIKPTIAASYHSSGQEIFWQYKNEQNVSRDKQIAEKIAIATGYKLSTPKIDAIGGGYTDWFIDHYHLPAVTIEICPLIEETSPPLSTLSKEWEKNKQVADILVNQAKEIENAHKN